MAVAVLLIFAAGCVRPVSDELFIRADGPDYEWEIDFTDTTKTYDLAFYSRIDCPRKLFVKMPANIYIKALFTAPSGSEYVENLTIHKEEFKHVSAYVRDAYIPYRKDLVPKEHGIWKFSLHIDNQYYFTGLRGMGLQVVRKDINGK